MKERGFDYRAPVLVNAHLASEEDYPPSASIEFAENFGFGITTRATADPRDGPYYDASPPKELSESERDAYSEALNHGPNPCYEAHKNSKISISSFRKQFHFQLQEMHSKFVNDPRLLAIQDDWQTCVLNTGYQFSSQKHIDDYFNKRLSEVTAGSTDGKHDALSKLREEEIATAVALFGCNDESYTKIAAIEREYELEFVANNFDQLQEVLITE